MSEFTETDLLEAQQALPADNGAMADALVQISADDLADLDAIVSEILDTDDNEQQAGGIEDVFGRDKTAEVGQWVPVSKMGEPGDLIRRLQIPGKPIVEFKVAKVPNTSFNNLVDLLQRKWALRHKDPLPMDKIRHALPAIYAKAVFLGIKNLVLRATDTTFLTDNFAVRQALLRRYSPELLDAIDKYGRELKNFQTDTEREVTIPNFSPSSIGTGG